MIIDMIDLYPKSQSNFAISDICEMCIVSMASRICYRVLILLYWRFWEEDSLEKWVIPARLHKGAHI